MIKKKISKLKVSKVNRFVYVKPPRTSVLLSDPTTVTTTTLTGF